MAHLNIVSRSISLIILIGLFYACNYNPKYKLPYIGQQTQEDGSIVEHTIRPFQFIDQDSNTVTNKTFGGKVYVTDFFFVSCPSICPLMTKQMLRLYRHYENNPNVLFLSHTIDPRHDTVGRLKRYADKLGSVSSSKWHFVTGERDSIYSIANDYFIAVQDESNNGEDPNKLIHSGKFMLIDRTGHVRSFCDGTDPKAVDHFVFDIDQLLKEKENPSR